MSDTWMTNLFTSNMEVLTMTQRSIKIAAVTLVVVSIFADICVHTKIHRLKIEQDARQQFILSTFGFLKDGWLNVNITEFSVLPQALANYAENTFGFTLDKSASSGITDYMEMNDRTCIFNHSDKPDEDKQKTFSIVFFRFDFRRNLILIERRGKDVKNLIISNRLDEHNKTKRDADRDTFSITSDQYLFNRARRAMKQKDSATVSDKIISSTAAPDIKASISTTLKPLNTSDGGETVTVSRKPDVPSNETDNMLLTSIPLLNNSGHFSAYFRVFIKRDEEEGMYSLYFHNCLGQKNEDSSSINLTVKLVEYNPGNFLSAGEMPIPYLFFVFTAVYLAATFLWVSVLHRCREDVYKIHYLMLSVVVVKVLACLFHAVNMYYIGKDGHHEEAWAVLYYIAYLMRGALFFITILLIGAGFAFIKYVLSDREKTLFLIVIPLQVLDYIAWVLVEESEEGQSHYDIWRGIFVLVDLLCCGAILFPVVWSIRHLTEGSMADGKAAISLLKLKLFRQFYIMIVCYIYFTRIIVYLVKIAVPFRYEWLNELLKEIATAVFFVVTGYKFRPAPDNPYLQVPQESDDEMEMDEVITKTGATDTVTRVNRHKGDSESKTSSNQCEHSHEYD
ncbi:hypothetical protein ACJMK2_038902 [Sinanodonta woodiana]|uniref:GOST seven transmembrane domain-containing protein n=1 Tax=Sinanodonta woodiana TaxID=1069815 RepID=A0ABD3WBG1_SINWO